MLASVTSRAEAVLCLKNGADIIDAKDPNAGALGALGIKAVEEIVSGVRAHSTRKVSATIGDLPCQPQPIAAAVSQMAQTGVDFVKIGFLPGGDPSGVVIGLADCELGSAKLVGVLFADQAPDFSLIPEMAEAGFAGVLIDSADKTAGSLTGILSAARIAEFITCARRAGLFAGLAGSLQLSDICPLSQLHPDILGFRGALCLDTERTFAIDETLVQSIRSHIDAVTALAKSPAR